MTGLLCISTAVARGQEGAIGRKLQDVNSHYNNVDDPQISDSLQRLLGNHKDNPTQVMVAPDQTRINQTQTGGF